MTVTGSHHPDELNAVAKAEGTIDTGNAAGTRGRRVAAAPSVGAGSIFPARKAAEDLHRRTVVAIIRFAHGRSGIINTVQVSSDVGRRRRWLARRRGKKDRRANREGRAVTNRTR